MPARPRRALPSRPAPGSGGARRPLAAAATLLPLALGVGADLAARTAATGPEAPALSEAEPSSSALALTCSLPFASIRQAHPIDDSCGPEGVATQPAQVLQNRAKNNFCAAGVPVPITVAQLEELQRAAEAAGVTFGSDRSIPADRAPLVDLLPLPGGGAVGEGKKVRLAAHVIEAHYSDVSRGESVNCKTPGNESNDIHIVLGERSPADDPCTSVTAEMSPHFRPLSWTPENLNRLSAHDRMVRVTGQLFFDASHAPCRGDTRANPPRRSLWEIHPVYEIDVCKDPGGARCAVDADADWIPLQQWLGPGVSEGAGGDGEEE